MKLTVIMLLPLICNTGGIIESNLPQCLESLRTYLKLELKVHQIMIIADNHEKINDEKLLPFLIESIPLLLIDFPNANKEVLENSRTLRFIKNSQLTTLFTMIVNANDPADLRKLTRSMNFISSLSYSKGHPKCLFLVYSLRGNFDFQFEQFLRTMWNKRFLDVMILHIASEERNRNTFLINETLLATVQQFNPYFEKFTKEHCSRLVQFFPDKLRDLNGYKIKYGTYNHPMTNYVKFNLTGYPDKMQGLAISYSMFLSRVMNFQLTFIRSNVTEFWRFDCNNKNTATGYTSFLFFNEMQFISVFFPHIPNCLFDTISFGRIDIVVLVPIIMKTIDGIEGKLLLYLNASISFFVLLLIWILIRILKFERRYWKLMYIIQNVLQQYSPEMPRNTRERLVFSCLLIISFVYSSNLFGAFTGLNFIGKRELEFDTIEDVYESDLQPIGVLVITGLTWLVDEEMLKNFVRKHIGYELFMAHCLKHIVDAKNISCTMQRNEAEIFIQSTRNVYGKPQVKVVKEALYPTQNSFFLETNSPYSRKFEYILLQATDFGIIDKWRKEDLDFFGKPNTDFSTHNIASIHERILLFLLIGIIVLGFSLSVLTFVLEILVFKLLNSSRRITVIL